MPGRSISLARFARASGALHRMRLPRHGGAPRADRPSVQPTQVRPTSRIVLLAGVIAAFAAVAACGDPESDQAASSSSPTTTAPPPPSTTQAPPTTGAVADIAPAAQLDLCTRIEGTLSDWRVQGPTLGTPALNLLVQEWAFANGGLELNARIVGDRGIPDAITSATCPDTRRQAIEALNLPDLASGLVGLGG